MQDDRLTAGRIIPWMLFSACLQQDEGFCFLFVVIHASFGVITFAYCKKPKLYFFLVTLICHYSLRNDVVSPFLCNDLVTESITHGTTFAMSFYGLFLLHRWKEIKTESRLQRTSGQLTAVTVTVLMPTAENDE